MPNIDPSYILGVLKLRSVRFMLRILQVAAVLIINPAESLSTDTSSSNMPLSQEDMGHFASSRNKSSKNIVADQEYGGNPVADYRQGKMINTAAL
jgi:hypothetical protein